MPAQSLQRYGVISEPQQRSVMTGRTLALFCMLIGASLLYLAGRDYLYYAPIRKCAIVFLEGLVNKEVYQNDQSNRTQLKIKVYDIHIQGNRAIVNAGLAMPGNWVNVQLYATNEKATGWQILGVTELDPHIENREDLDLAREVETAFQAAPGIQIKRY